MRPPRPKPCWRLHSSRSTAATDMGMPAGRPVRVASRHSPCDSPAVSKRSIGRKNSMLARASERATGSSQELADLLPETRVYPRCAHQKQAESDEGDDAAERVQLPQVEDKQLQDAQEEQCEPGQAQNALAEWEAGDQERHALQAKSHGQHAAGDLVRKQERDGCRAEDGE